MIREDLQIMLAQVVSLLVIYNGPAQAKGYDTVKILLVGRPDKQAVLMWHRDYQKKLLFEMDKNVRYKIKRNASPVTATMLKNDICI